MQTNLHVVAAAALLSTIALAPSPARGQTPPSGGDGAPVAPTAPLPPLPPAADAPAPPPPDSDAPAPPPAAPPAHPPKAKRPVEPPRDGAVVHIESNDPDVSLYRKVRLIDFGKPTTEVVCVAPCDVLVERSMGDDLFLGVNKVPLGGTFSLPPAATSLLLRADVRMRPSRGRKIAGAVLLPLGVLEVAAGGLYMAVDWPSQNGLSVDQLYNDIGVGLMVVGGVMGTVGIALLATAFGSYDVDTPATTARSPIHLRGFGFAPPVPSSGGSSPMTATATWEF